MKEADYINATNLAKTRMAREIIRDILPGDPHILDSEHAFLMRALDAWQSRLERATSSQIRAEKKDLWRDKWPKWNEKT